MLIYEGLLQRNDPIFKVPVTRFSVRRGQKPAGPQMISPADTDSYQTDPTDPGEARKKPDRK